MIENSFEWDVTYHSTEKVGLDEFELYDIKDNRLIKVTVPDMEELYMGGLDEDTEFCVQIDKNQLGEIIPHQDDIVYFTKLENLYQVTGAVDFGDTWAVILDRYRVKRFLNWELN